MSKFICVDKTFVAESLPRRSREAHKGNFGSVYILAGSVGYTGAPVLAARAAVRTGSGLVFLGVNQEIWPIIAVKCDEAMPSPLPKSSSELLEKIARCDVVLVGPGLGRAPETDAIVLEIVKSAACPLVLDADGINAISGHIDVLDGRCDRLTILTPHDGEFARLTGGVPMEDPDSNQVDDRLEQTRAFAKMHGCVLVRKGHRTITAFPDGDAFLNTTGNPGMAKGGSGDVLAGMIASLIGQAIPPKRAVPMAVWLHGRAGDLCAAEKGEYGMIPTDMIERIPEAMKNF